MKKVNNRKFLKREDFIENVAVGTLRTDVEVMVVDDDCPSCFEVRLVKKGEQVTLLATIRREVYAELRVKDGQPYPCIINELHPYKFEVLALATAISLPQGVKENEEPLMHRWKSKDASKLVERVEWVTDPAWRLSVKDGKMIAEVQQSEPEGWVEVIEPLAEGVVR